ncbi:MAG TPA: hypothetical protein VFC65_00205 [Prolixibacteraceae bacterium]|nr:hypothetical protein [Prolixibacteraceae bacterium]
MRQITNKQSLSIIYLDQFASIGLFESKSREWKKIREWIITGVENKKIICPLSAEHYLETAQKEKQKAIALDTEFYKISGGFAFKSELFITSQLIISLIRQNNVTLKTYLYDEIFKNVLSDERNINTFKKTKKQLNDNIAEGTQLANEIRKITRDNRSDLKTKQQLILAHKSVNISEFISRLNDLLSEGHIFIRGVPFESGDVPHWIDQLIFQLTNKHRITKKETILLISELEKFGFNNIPTLDIRTSLSAIISAYNKNETVNDQIDIMRISTGLPISDILLTDKQRKNEILELGINEKYHTKIYSGTKNDLEELIIEFEEKRLHITAICPQTYKTRKGEL